MQTNMNIPLSTDILVEDLLNATYGNSASTREKFVFRQALLGLVRLAKAEQVFEMRTTVEKLIGGKTSVASRQRNRQRGRNDARSGGGPEQMQFSPFD
jgi:hypothetical protein